MTLSARDLREKQAALGLESLWFFANAICGQRFTEAAHGDVIRALETGDWDEILILMARGHYKTHLVACYFAWRIARDRNVRILSVSNTFEMAQEVLGLVQQILTLPKVQELYGSFVGPTWSTKALVVSGRTEVLKEDTLTITGIDSFQPGGHFDLVWFEDVENQETTSSPEQREKTRQVDSLSVPMTDEPGAKRGTTGTIYHEQDLYCHKVEQYVCYVLEKDEKGVERPRYVNDVVREMVPGEDSEEGDEAGGRFRFFYKPIRRPDGSILLPERFTERKIARIKRRMSESDFAKQYELNPRAGGGKAFQKDDWNYVTNPPKNVAFHVLGGDFASSIATDSDFCGFAIVAFDQEANGVVVHAEAVRLSTDGIMDYLFDAHAKYPNLWFALEEDNFVRGWRPQFEIKCRQRGLYQLITPRTVPKSSRNHRVTWIVAGARKNKFERIVGALQSALRSRALTLLPQARIVETQGEVFPDGSKDVLDALANAMELIKESADPSIFAHLSQEQEGRQAEFDRFRRRPNDQPYNRRRGDLVPWKAS